MLTSYHSTGHTHDCKESVGCRHVLHESLVACFFSLCRCRHLCSTQVTALNSSAAPKQPQPPLHSRQHGSGASSDKRFTVRDGFHLKTRNDEKQRAIDQQLAAPPSDAPVVSVPQSVVRVESGASDASGPSELEIPQVVRSKLSSTKERIAASRLQSRSNNNADDNLECDEVDSAMLLSQTTKANGRLALSTTRHAPFPLPSSRTAAEATAIAARLEPSSDWLIYRSRVNVTPRRRDQRIEEMVQRVLQTAEPPASASNASSSSLATGVTHAPLVTILASTTSLQPSRPRQPSLSGSTYHQRVLAARQQAAKPSTSSRSLYPLGELTPASATERSLLSSREATNRDVDRLLVTLFQQQQLPQQQQQPPLAHSSNLKFATRRSVLREQTAAALKGRNLVSRMDELRSLPQVLEQMVQKQREQRQQLVARHGQDLVLWNKQQSCVHLLQRPPLTPVFPSSVEQKQQQATRRKQVTDANDEAAVRSAANRWQQRRQDDARRMHHQCQWLLLTTLAEASVGWLGRFHDWKLKRDMLRRVTMTRRIQAFWRARVMTHRRTGGAGYRSGLSAVSGAPLPTLNARLSRITNATVLLQRTMRRWRRRQQDARNVAAVGVIVTSWLEFQDVKFRRLILRFRKRVRDFQVMWRAWRAITDARLKLLLLVWAKLEKRSKRRNGVNVRPLANTTGVIGSALVHSLQAAHQQHQVLSPEMRQKHFEGMHRHLKNGGTIQAPLAIAATVPSGGPGSVAQRRSNKPLSIATIALSMRAHPTRGRVKLNREVEQQIGEDFQHAMQDFFDAPSSLSSPSRFADRGHGRIKGGVASSSPGVASTSPHASWKALADAVGTPTRPEKIPLPLKLATLRQLLSEKRKAFQVAKDKKRCVSSCLLLPAKCSLSRSHSLLLH